MTKPIVEVDGHKSDQQLQAEIAAAGRRIQVGATYQHYKGADRRYRVIGFATLEATDELCVVYQALYGPGFQFIRPVSVWLEDVEWAGRTVPRFTLVA